MKPEELKVGKKITFNNHLYEIIDTKYVEELIICKRCDYPYLTSFPKGVYDMLEEPKDPEYLPYKIVVSQSKTNPRQIEAKITVEGTTYIGAATCGEEDVFDYAIGAKLAIDRCLKALNLTNILLED